MASKIDRNADDQERCRRNWQRLVEGGGSNLILVDNSTLDFNGAGGSLEVAAGGIGTTQLANNAVTAGKIANNAVQNAKIQNSAVTLSKLNTMDSGTIIGRFSAGNGTAQALTFGGDITFSSGTVGIAAFTGDATKTAGGTALTLASVFTNAPGLYNLLTINAKGLAINGTLNSYSTTTLANDTLWAAKGDLAVATANDTASIVSVGANEKILVADSAATNGVAWRSPLICAAIDVDENAQGQASKVALVALQGRQLSSAELAASKASVSKTVMEEFVAYGAVNSVVAGAGDTLTITLDVLGGVAGGTVTTVQTHVITLAGSESEVPIIIEAWGGWNSTGVSGKVAGAMRLTYGTTATVTIYTPQPTGSMPTIDTTGTINQFRLSQQFSTSRVGQNLTIRGGNSKFTSRGLTL